MRIAQITDLHLTESPHTPFLGLDNHQRFLQVLAVAKALQPDAYVLSGDFSAQAPSLNSLYWLREQLRSLQAPWYLLAGNHDNRAMLRDVFSLPGSADAPLDYTFTVANQNLIAIDSSASELSPSQLIWLEEQLALPATIGLFIHHPPIPLGCAFMDRKHALKNSAALQAVLAKQPVAIPIFCGHYHTGTTATLHQMTVHACPPTSFHIDPMAESFVQRQLPPAFQLIRYEAGQLSVLPYYT